MKRIIFWTLAAALLMIGGPYFALKFPGWDAMAVFFLLFFFFILRQRIRDFNSISPRYPPPNSSIFFYACTLLQNRI